ncbi:MAG: hypothetical protein H6622_06430 [Halobacteriovoraceae bacterium]|nr:hypothetical protein [Halobacteriovoraceae bacterium]
MLRFCLFVVTITMAINVYSQTNIGITQLSNINTQPSAGNSPDNNLVWANFEFFDTKKFFEFNNVNLSYLVNAKTRIHFGNTAQFSVPELYAKYDSANTTLYLGRKILNWNSHEGFWGIDHIDHIQAMDFASQEREGLAGIYISTKFYGINFSVLSSPVYIPQLNPGMRVVDGKVKSSSEWAQLPPTHAEITPGNIEPIEYVVNRPSNSEILLQRSFGLRVAKDYPKGSVSAYGLFKPENQLRLNIDGKYDPNKYVAEVQVTPVVNHHMIYGFEWVHNLRDLSFTIGSTLIDPNDSFFSGVRLFDFLKIDRSVRDEVVQTSTQKRPNYVKESYYYLGATKEYKNLKLALFYLDHITKHNNADEYLFDTVKWHQAIGTNVAYFSKYRFKIESTFKYDFKMRDLLSQIGVSREFSKGLTGKLMTTLVSSPNANSYWTPFRANDLIYSQLSYTF